MSDQAPVAATPVCRHCRRAVTAEVLLLRISDDDQPEYLLCAVCDHLLDDLEALRPCEDCGHARGFHHAGPCEHGWDGRGTKGECDCPGYRPRLGTTAMTAH